jgi:hypothetical protein
MEYKQDKEKTPMASEPSAVYEASTKRVSKKEIREHCLTLEESKQKLLETVHKHFHP